MSIKINKQLNRPDGGKVASGSVVEFNTTTVDSEKKVVFYCKQYLSETARDNGKTPVPAIVEIGSDSSPYYLSKYCTDEEWDDLTIGENQTAILLNQWLQEIIDSLIGLGYTEIV